MRVLCLGAGAIGSYVGGSLAAAGHEVLFLERPQAAAALAATGLRIELPGGRLRQVATPEVLSDLAELPAVRRFDLTLVAVKTYDTPAALAMLAPCRARLGRVLCLQNGVEQEQALGAALGSQRVLAGTVVSAVERRGPGAIRLATERGLGIAAGAWPGRHALGTLTPVREVPTAADALLPDAATLVAAFVAAGLPTRLYRDPASLKWSKLLTNLIANASCAILGWSPAAVLVDRALFGLELRQLREARTVMAALRAPVVDLPGAPTRLLAAATRLPAWAARPLLARRLGRARGAKLPSLALDLAAGQRASEVEALNGAVARQGAWLGVPTPVNRTLAEVLSTLAREGTPGAWAGQADRLVAACAAASGS